MQAGGITGNRLSGRPGFFLAERVEDGGLPGVGCGERDRSIYAAILTTRSF
jgi:hypothetical protein